MEKTPLFTVVKDVICVACGNKGAVQPYGDYYPNGVGAFADDFPPYEKYRNSAMMSNSVGFGGTVPHTCLNCGNEGLVGFGGLEGYKKAFFAIKKDEE